MKKEPTESEVMLKIFEASITTGVFPKPGSPCHKKLLELINPPKPMWVEASQHYCKMCGSVKADHIGDTLLCPYDETVAALPNDALCRPAGDAGVRTKNNRKIYEQRT